MDPARSGRPRGGQGQRSIPRQQRAGSGDELPGRPRRCIAAGIHGRRAAPSRPSGPRAASLWPRGCRPQRDTSEHPADSGRRVSLCRIRDRQASVHRCAANAEIGSEATPEVGKTAQGKWKYPDGSPDEGRSSGGTALVQLAGGGLYVILQAHLVDESELYFEEVDMLFLALLDVDQEFAGDEVPD